MFVKIADVKHVSENILLKFYLVSPEISLPQFDKDLTHDHFYSQFISQV